MGRGCHSRADGREGGRLARTGGRRGEEGGLGSMRGEELGSGEVGVSRRG